MAVRLGFIGFGIMGERLLRAALDHDPSKIQVAGVYDPAPSARARLHSIDTRLVFHASVAAVIEASDCLHIASPPASHLAYLEACAAAGRAAFCEKPLATDMMAAADTVRRLASAGTRAAVNFPFASSLAVDQLLDWIGSGVIGTPQRIDIDLAFANWPRPWQAEAASWLDRRAEGGFTREVASHFLFLSRRIGGPLKLETARCRYPDPMASERQINAILTAGALPVRLAGEVGQTIMDDHNIWMLTGSAGRIRLRDWSVAEHEIAGRWTAAQNAIANEKARPLVLARQLDKLAAMTAHEATNLATLGEGLDVQRVVEAILASAPDA